MRFGLYNQAGNIRIGSAPYFLTGRIARIYHDVNVVPLQSVFRRRLQ